MPVGVIKIESWNLSYVNDEGFVGVDDVVPAMQVQLAFHADCPNAAMNIDKVTLLNSDSLQFSRSGIDTRYSGLARGPFVDGQSYVNIAHVLISQLATSVELKYGLYWANCDQPRDQWGVPRFAFQARTVVQCQVQSNYYSQKWSKVAGWGAQDPTPVYISPAQHLRLTSLWSALSQIGAHFNCQQCLQMIPGAGRDWVWYPPQEFPIFSTPSPAPSLNPSTTLA